MSPLQFMNHFFIIEPLQGLDAFKKFLPTANATTFESELSFLQKLWFERRSFDDQFTIPFYLKDSRLVPHNKKYEKSILDKKVKLPPNLGNLMELH